MLALPKKMNYYKRYTSKNVVVTSDWVEGNRQAILPFLKTPGTKVQIMMIMVTPVGRFGDLLVATLRVSRGNKCHFHYYSHPLANY